MKLFEFESFFCLFCFAFNVAYMIECDEVSQSHVWNVICDLTWNGLKVKLSQGLKQNHSQKGWTLNQWWSLIRRWKAGPSEGGCMEEETGCTAWKGRAAWDHRSYNMDRTSLWAFEGTCSASTSLAEFQPPELWGNSFLLFKPYLQSPGKLAHG